MSRTHVTVSFATHSNVSSISSHTACYLGRPKQLATEIANRRQGGLPDTVFEKNYRLQDIQLSKNPPSRFRASAWAGPRLARSCPKFVVENTGLEPVTSWLQTRRSPS